MMRITFLTQDDPIYILPFFEAFFSELSSEIEVSAVFACRSMGNRKRSKLVRELLTLYGPLGFARLAGLQIAARAGSALKCGAITGRHYSLSDLAAHHRVLYRRIGNPNSQQNLAAIATNAPDVVVSVACPFILKRAALNIAAKASLNIHHAPLPRYKGMMPTFWQMYHGETALGMTIHTMSEKLDEGEIIHQEWVPVGKGETMHGLIRRSKRRGASAMLAVLKQYASGKTPAALPASREVSYFTFPTASEMQDFHQRGLRAI